MSYETVRRWVTKFGAHYANELRKHEVRRGRTWHLDEMAIRVGGRLHWRWRAVDEHGQTIDVLLQERRDTAAAERFFGGCWSARFGHAVAAPQIAPDCARLPARRRPTSVSRSRS